jgi:uncharacterized membrane protein YbaN (DUF454 family)
MYMSIFLARIFGLYLLFMGVALLLKRKWFQKTLDDFFNNRAALFLAAIFTLILGIILVVSHSIFIWNWQFLVTLLAWLTLLKGLLYLFIPEKTAALSRGMMKHAGAYYISACICCLLGAYLLYQGFLLF